MTVRVLVTCEHGGNRVPHRYAPVFEGAGEVLRSHRGHDAGALALARALAYRLAVPLVFSTVTRLLVDLNRSPGHPGQFSEYTRRLPGALREEILREHYLPYRTRVIETVERLVAEGHRVVHLSAHSFTPVWKGALREVDLGLLHDPARAGERAFCGDLRRALRERQPGLRVHFNRPYRGTSDGLTRTLRERFGGDAYLGIELEVNQRFPLDLPNRWPSVARSVVEAVEEALPGA